MDREIIRRRRMSVGVNECGASNIDLMHGDLMGFNGDLMEFNGIKWNLMEFNGYNVGKTMP